MITAVNMGLTARFGNSDSERDTTMRTLWAKNALTLLQALNSPESQSHDGGSFFSSVEGEGKRRLR
jgi:hypothetical protein